MQVQMRDIDSIKPYNNNPRFNDEAVDAVAKSIKAFRFRQPLVVDENDVIVVGDTRYKAAKRLGLKKIPVHTAKGLSHGPRHHVEELVNLAQRGRSESSYLTYFANYNFTLCSVSSCSVRAISDVPSRPASRTAARSALSRRGSFTLTSVSSAARRNHSLASASANRAAS